jgi:hypothetical protein
MTDLRDLLWQKCPLCTVMTLTLKRQALSTVMTLTLKRQALRTVMALILKRQALRSSKTYEEFLLSHRRQSYRKLRAKWILWLHEVRQE